MNLKVSIDCSSITVCDDSDLYPGYYTAFAWCCLTIDGKQFKCQIMACCHATDSFMVNGGVKDMEGNYFLLSESEMQTIEAHIKRHNSADVQAMFDAIEKYRNRLN